VIINKVKDVDDFKDTYMGMIDDLGIKVLGIIPFQKDLTYLSIGYISDVLFAKVLAGEENFSNQVKEIYIGAMSGDAALKNPLFSKESKLIITSGDREDMCLAALEGDTAGIILTNNILPSTKIINQAKSKKIPLLLVPGDTFHTAKQVDDMEHLITKNDLDKVDLLERIVRENVDLDGISG
jgi:BioD-like phosphotransacetylase family protein